ncbi:hypothetical protein FHR72_004793 [Mycolicibacterium iranicum]|uniref:S26 family signal peptidase n=1 Tax=Mycolicibacterium iranicum TaxID=912594 RepID=A0A839QFJ9_MYCIR|nr:S24 family peptidase [Mycolicibacterium iranicum]MBB2993285.1 hypothetical protein [Mycolicibacterium iranicum]
MRRNQRPSRWADRLPARVFTVVEDSMRPTLSPGDVVFTVRDNGARVGQLRVFRHPHKSTRWLVKRVGEVYDGGVHGTVFEARSDNARAPGATDSHEFGWVPVAGSYRVVWTLSRER